MEKLTKEQVHDKVMGNVRSFLDSYQMADLEFYASFPNCLAKGCTVTKYAVTVYFPEKTFYFRRNY